MSSSPELLKLLGVKCDGSHTHQELLSGRAAAAAIYPADLVVAIIKGMEAQTRREGESMPASLRVALDQGIAVYDLSVGDAASGAIDSDGGFWRKRVDPCGGTGLASCEPRPPKAALAVKPRSLQSMEMHLDSSFAGPALGTEEEGLQAASQLRPGRGARRGRGREIDQSDDDDDGEPPEMVDLSDDEGDGGDGFGGAGDYRPRPEVAEVYDEMTGPPSRLAGLELRMPRR